MGALGAVTAGSDAAADAVSDSIKDLFNLADQPGTPPASPPAPKAQVAPKAVKVLKATPESKAPKVPPAVKAITAPKAPPAPKPAKLLQKDVVPKPVEHVKPPDAHPSVVKKQVPATTAKHPKTTKAAVSQPEPKQPTPAIPEHSLVSKAAPTLAATATKQQKPTTISNTRSATERKSSTGHQQLKAPEKVQDLEAEVRALKAKLALASPVTPVVKPKKATAVAPAVPAPPKKAASVAPVVAPPPQKATAVAPAVVTPAVAVSPRVIAQPPVAATVAMASVKPALSAKVDLEPAFHEPELAEPALHQPGEEHLAASLPKDSPPAEPVRPADVAVASSKGPPPIELGEPKVALTTTSVLTMTMVPLAPAAPQAFAATAVSAPSPVSFFGSIGHWFHRAFFGADLPAAVPTEAPLPVADPNAGRPAFSKQDMERTSASAHEDGLADVAIEDEFIRKENEDIDVIDKVKREDRALRLDAQTPKKPAMPAPANFQHRAGSTHISQFWETLSEEDADIESALAKDGNDLSEYERLKSLQDAKLDATVSAINGPLGEHLAIERRALRKAASSPA